jgi:hypothetical protein
MFVGALRPWWCLFVRLISANETYVLPPFTLQDDVSFEGYQRHLKRYAPYWPMQPPSAAMHAWVLVLIAYFVPCLPPPQPRGAGPAAPGRARDGGD